MKRRACNPFPHDTDYDHGDANHLPIVPAVEDLPDTSREEPTNPNSCPAQQPAPGDAGQKEKTS